MEATYRQVGEHIRQLPSITPPPALRAAVFAAIRAEEAHGDRTLEQMTSDQTQPHLPVLRSGRLARRGVRSSDRVALGTRSAIAVAAVLLLSLFTARLLPALAGGMSDIARGIASGPLYLNGGATPSTPRVEHYATDVRSGLITGAMASGQWLAYVATDHSGRSMLAVENRATLRTVPLLAAPSETPLTVLAISDQWVIWLAGTTAPSSSWTLWATPLSAGNQAAAVPTLADGLATAPDVGQAMALVSNADGAPDAPALLSGVWLSGNTVLAAESTHAGNAQVIQLELVPGQAAPTAQIIAHAQQPGHLLTSPSAENGMYYWAEVWADTATGLHSDVWQSDGTGPARQVTTSANAFAPHAAEHALVWVQARGTIALDAAAGVSWGQAVHLALAQLGGTLQMRDLNSGNGRELGANALATSVAVAGPLVIWQDGAQVHTYDLAHNGPSAVEAQVRSASVADASGNALVWAQAGSSVINVYDGR
jgi:hypothetical protein